MGNIIECHNLSKTYKEVEALKNLNFKVPDQGCIVGLLGPNGSGKTTFIKLLTGLLTPTTGSVTVCGKEIGVESKALISYLSDCYSLYENYKVSQQIDYYEDFFSDFNRQKAEKMLNELGIDINFKIKNLSKGNKEKLSLILTLAREARLYILDEPIAGVDPAARDYILKTIISMKNENSTILISTHLISEIEHYFDYVLMIKNGSVVMEGPTQEIRDREGKTIDELFREIFKWI